MPTDAILWAHALSTTLLTGLIWFVQIVHYPLFARVGRDRFTIYEREHQTRTSFVVGPLMLVEAATAGAILFAAPILFGDAAARIQLVGAAGFSLVLLLWATTALVQVPLHKRLEEGYDDDAVRRLVATNRIRTAAWTARAPIALWLLTHA